MTSQMPEEMHFYIFIIFQGFYSVSNLAKMFQCSHQHFVGRFALIQTQIQQALN